MVQTNKKMFTRVWAIVLSVAMLIAMMPMSVLASDKVNYGTVTTFTGGTVTGNGTANVEVVINEAELEWIAGNAVRADGWWVGISAKAPKGFSEDAKLKTKSNPAAEYGEAMSFAEYKDGEDHVELWFSVSPESLKQFTVEGTNITKMYTFDWNADDVYEQTIVFSVVPSEKIVLKKDGVQMYPKAPLYGTVSTFTGGEVTGNGTANVEVVIDEVELQWIKGNDVRADGWWVGIAVTAPENFNADATFKKKSNSDDKYSDAMSFATYKDGDDYVELWFSVSPESLKKSTLEGSTLTMNYTFDWNSDAVYEQTIAFTVVPSEKIVLKNGDTQEYPKAPLFGTVSTFTGGTVTGNGTANVEILIDEVELQWIKGNDVRADGWWVGISAKAPEGFAADAAFRIKSNPTDEYGAAKSFAEYKDGDDHIELWFSVSPASLEKFASEGLNITKVYNFDWNGDAVYGQTITFSVKPSDKIVLNQNVTVNKNEGGTVKVNGEEADVVAVQAGKNTEIAVSADKGYQIESLTVAGNAVADAVGKESFKYNSADILGDSVVSVKFVKVWTVSFKVGDNGKVTYNIDGNAPGGEITDVIIKDKNTISVKAFANENYHINYVKVDEKFVFEKGTNTNKEFEYKFDVTKETLVVVDFAPDQYKLVYEHGKNGSVAWENAYEEVKEITVSHGGDAKLNITPEAGNAVSKATVNGEDVAVENDENGLFISFANVTEAMSVKVLFEAPEIVNIEEDKKLSNEYYTIDCEQVKDAYFDGDTYVIVLKKDGKATIKPVAPYNKIKVNDKNANGEYLDSIEIADTTTIENLYVSYGNLASEKKDLAVNIKVIIDKVAPVVADIEEPAWTNSAVTINGTVSDEADSSGLKKIVWSKGALLGEDEIIAKLDTENAADIVDGAFSFTTADEAQHVIYYIYAVDYAGNISAQKAVKVKIDKTNPEITDFEITDVKKSPLEKLWNFLTFGIFFNDQVKITVTANDLFNGQINSGVKSITLCLDGKEFETKEVTDDNKAEFTVLKNELGEPRDLGEDEVYKVVIGAKAIDKAGNETAEIQTPTSTNDPDIKNDNLMLENVAPTISVDTTLTLNGEHAEADHEADGKRWYSKDIYFKVTAKDTDSGIRSVVISINGTVLVSPELGNGAFNQLDEKTTEETFYVYTGADGVEIDDATSSYTLEAKVIDNAGNEYELPTEDKVVIYKDTLAPNISKDKVIFEQKNDGPFAQVMNFLTFGMFFNEKLVVTVHAEDFTAEGVKGSGVKSYALSFYKENETTPYFETAEQEGNNIFEINYDELENFKGTVKVILKDKVENDATLDLTTGENGNSNLGDTTFMLENDAPIVNITTENDSIYKGVFNFKFNVTDKTDKYYSGLAGVEVFVNGTDLSEEFANDNNNQIISKEYGVNDFAVDPVKQTVNGKEIENWNAGKLTFAITAYDRAGNVSATSETTVYVDNTAPVITEFKLGNEKQTEAFEKVVEVLSYGFFFKENVEVTITAKDSINEATETAISGVKSITTYLHDVDSNVYYTVEKDGNKYILVDVKNAEEANTLEFDTAAETQSITFTVPANFKGQIFAYATDDVGNKPTDCLNRNDGFTREDGDFVQPDGSIVENTDKHEATSSIEIVAPEKTGVQNNTGSFADDKYGMFEGSFTNEDTKAVADYDTEQLVPLYNTKNNGGVGEVVFDVTVTDTYSGIKTVECFVNDTSINKLNVKIDGTLENNTLWSIESTDRNLVTSVNAKIAVNGNSNDMVLVVKLTDRAGNVSYDYYMFGIDITAPTIEIAYGEEEIHDEEYTDYFRTNRTATVTITERNFRAEDVVIKATKDNKAYEIKPTWSLDDSSNDPDKTKHIATINYTSDGDYTLDISYTDNAGNKAEDKSDAFTIDKTLPTVSVAYDNNSAQNGNYYKAQRIATITIVEHNFDAKRVNIIGTATDNGSVTKFPELSAWKTEGDTHVATIVYEADSKYSFDIEFLDMAGNSIDDFAVQEFYVDKTNPVVQITGIVDQSANKGEGNVGFVVIATDTNFDTFTPVLTGVFMTENGYETKPLTIGNTENITNGKQYVVTNIADDGIYSITCTVVDKAGNAFSEVILEDASGRKYTEKRSGNDKLAVFSVNRNGSTFALDTYTAGLVKDYYVKNVTNNVNIIEINPDPIVEDSITLKGKTLVKNKDYTVSLENGEGTWYKYTYSINKELFADESEYNTVVSSKDKATNEAFSDVKGVTLKFVVDRTAPTVTVAGLKKNGRYRVDKQIVTLIPSDDGGELKSVIVRTLDKNGKVLKVLVDLTGEELLAAIEAGKITFELEDELYQNVQIICEDFAGNITGADDEEVYTNVSVTTNWFMLFWAFKALRWGTIIGIVLLTAAIIFFVVYKKHKKNEAQ